MYIYIYHFKYGHKEQITTDEHSRWCKTNCRGIIQDDDLKDIIMGLMSNGRIKANNRSEVSIITKQFKGRFIYGTFQ